MDTVDKERLEFTMEHAFSKISGDYNKGWALEAHSKIIGEKLLGVR